jgi:hypothetical protein
VEDVVKYEAKILYNKPFEDIETLNTEPLYWLRRTAQSNGSWWHQETTPLGNNLPPLTILKTTKS